VLELGWDRDTAQSGEACERHLRTNWRAAHLHMANREKTMVLAGYCLTRRRRSGSRQHV